MLGTAFRVSIDFQELCVNESDFYSNPKIIPSAIDCLEDIKLGRDDVCNISLNLIILSSFLLYDLHDLIVYQFLCLILASPGDRVTKGGL